MNYEDYQDGEIFSLICENNEDAKDLLFEKYKYIIEIIIKKYSYTALKYGLEYKDIYQEALLGFSDALQSYNEEKNVKLATFISLCVDRRLQNVIRKAGSEKNLIFKDALSLNHIYETQDVSLEEFISDTTYEPLLNISKLEDSNELQKIIKKRLSSGEYQLYSLLLNGCNYEQISKKLKKTTKQIDNTLQRIRIKIKEILNARNNY